MSDGGVEKREEIRKKGFNKHGHKQCVKWPFREKWKLRKRLSGGRERERERERKRKDVEIDMNTA